MREEAKNVVSIYPLSATQSGMLFHTLYEPQSEAYFEQLSCTLTGHLDTGAFERAWQSVTERHPVLRTAFAWKNTKKPLQVVSRKVTLELERHDWRERDRHEQDLAEFAALDRARGFELNRPPLMRCILVQLDETRWRFIWSFHHLILDGWSQQQVLGEVFTSYQALTDGEPLPTMERPRPYRDYILWLDKQPTKEAETFWRDHLQGLTAPTSMETSHPAATAIQSTHEETQLLLEGAETKVLTKGAQTAHVTLNTVVQAGLALLLAHYAGERKVVFGATLSGRTAQLDDVATMVGMFINTLPVVIDCGPPLTVRAWLKQIQACQLERERFAHCSLIQLREWSEVSADMPLFESILVFENYPVSAAIPERIEGLQISQISRFEQSNYPFTFAVVPDERLTLKLNYDAARVTQTGARRMLGHLHSLLQHLAKQPDCDVSRISLLNDAARDELLRLWNRTPEDLSPDCIHRLFEVQASRTPEAVALLSVIPELSWSYRELDQRANRLAHHLRSHGLGPGKIAAICCDRSLQMVEALLAVLKSGAAYLPLNPEDPPPRLALVLDDARPHLILGLQTLLERLPAGPQARIALDDGFDHLPDDRLQINVTLDDPAYLIYTSGSTGQPKGVLVGHGAIANRLLWARRAYPLTASDRFLLLAAFSFDISLWEICAPLLAGATLVLPPGDISTDTARIVDAMDRYLISTVHFVPSLLQSFLEEPDLNRATNLRLVFCGGEAMSAQLHNRLLERLDCECHHFYGPTEAAINITAWNCRDSVGAGRVSLGEPISNARIFLLDSRLEPVPSGIRGELYLGGTPLAMGYLNRPALTAESFLPDPFSDLPGARIYRSGDQMLRAEDGGLEFLGRSDHQVKLRGLRIELGEIEHALSQLDGVGKAAVLLLPDRKGYQRLTAFVETGREVAAKDANIQQHIQTLRNQLSAKLPAHMVPTRFKLLDRLPLLASGKLDRRSLSKMVLDSTAGKGDPPTNRTEEKLCAIWRDVLGLEQIGIHDDFFQVGGDSILSLQIVARAHKQGLHITPQQVFQQLTIASLAQVANTSVRMASDAGPATGNLPLTPIQAAFFQHNQPEPHHFNQAVMLRLPETVDAATLDRVITLLAHHHDALRLRFTASDEGIVQHYAEPKDIPSLIVHDLAGMLAADRAGALQQEAGKLQTSLNLAKGPLFQAALFRMGDDGCRLLLVIHHLAIDGVSWRILLADLETAYEQAARGERPRLPARSTSFKDWSLKLREYARCERFEAERRYWTEVFPPRARQAGTSLAGWSQACPGTYGNSESHISRLDASLTDTLLRGIHRAYNTRIEDILLAALAYALGEVGKTGLVLVALEGHGREPLFDDVDLSRTLGWFTTRYPVALDTTHETGHNLDDLIVNTKESLRQVPNRGIGYGLLAESDLKPALPRPRVLFNYLGQIDQVTAGSALLSGERVESTGAAVSPANQREHLADITCLVSDGQFEASWSWDRSQAETRYRAGGRFRQGTAPVDRTLRFHTHLGLHSFGLPPCRNRSGGPEPPAAGQGSHR